MGNKESIVHSIVVVYGILKEQIADTVTLLREVSVLIQELNRRIW